jgi:hypothetical protein
MAPTRLGPLALRTCERRVFFEIFQYLGAPRPRQVGEPCATCEELEPVTRVPFLR